MDVSVVIVNYNVKHFLEQCLHSVEKSLKNIEGEIFVVDNNSVDGSCQMVTQKFPNVRLIENKDNVGFSKANNQAIKQCKGQYILILNPDTFVQEDTLEKCVNFCNNTPEAGAVGVKMIDGKGEFLPESKRSLPTPEVAFYKIFGLSSLFPKSKRFGKYHLGHLDNNKIHEVEILAGAFMFVRNSVLKETGLLDETFFMYGEDIDLSYRIIKAGYKNYYFPESTIIHYKGESTKKGSINYVMVFYKAMIIFANKHFSTKRASLYKLLINTAIYFRATIGICNRIFLKLFRPVIDLSLIYGGFFILTSYWERLRFANDSYYPKEFYQFAIPGIVLVWMFFLYVFGSYERKVKPASVLRGIASGFLFVLFIYALLPESLRFSRALIFLGAAWAIVASYISRLLGAFIFQNRFRFEFKKKEKRIAIVGSELEAERVKKILMDSGVSYLFIGRVSETTENAESVLGSISQVNEIIQINKIDELVFCSQDLTATDIINTMLIPEGLTTSFKIAPPESVSVIGSNSINTAGDLYVVDINSLSKGMNKRKKRMFDILSGVVLLITYPISLFIVPKPFRFFRNMVMVIVGRYTWVGITLDRHHNIHHMELKKGVLQPYDGLKTISSNIKQRMVIMYAKDYKVYNDFIILSRCYRLLGQTV